MLIKCSISLSISKGYGLQMICCNWATELLYNGTFHYLLSTEYDMNNFAESCNSLNYIHVQLPMIQLFLDDNEINHELKNVDVMNYIIK